MRKLRSLLALLSVAVALPAQGPVEKLDALLLQRGDGWLGPGDLPGFRLPLSESVRDERDDKSVALPELPPPPALDR